MNDKKLLTTREVAAFLKINEKKGLSIDPGG